MSTFKTIQLAEHVLNALSAHIAVLDETGNIVTVNNAWRLFAIENTPLHLAGAFIGVNYLAVCDQVTGVNAKDAAAVAEGIRSVMRGDIAEYVIEYCFDSSSVNGWFICRVTAFPWESTLRVVVSHANITQRKLTENKLRISATAFETQEGIIVADENGIILRVNQAFLGMTGYKSEEVIGQGLLIFRSERHHADFYATIWSEVELTGMWKGEVWNQRKNGENYPEHVTVTAVKDPDGIITNYVLTLAEITMSNAAAEEIKSLAFYDPLTKLPNRRLLLDRLNLALISSARSGEDGALLIIDLDDFKTLNDTLGHGIGDLLLQQVAQRLLACVRSTDTVARLGGDEFVVLLEGLGAQSAPTAEAESIGIKILNVINQPYTLISYQRHSTASIGITLLSGQEADLDTLLQQADIAMYQAKKAGRNTLRFFDKQMQESINDRASLEGELRKALIKKQFQLYYQAQVDQCGQEIGAEVLLRWIHPELGVVSPAQFIPLAEETGLLLPIGLWVLDTACAQIKSWQQNPLTSKLTLSVNVSASQFRHVDFFAQVQEALSRYALNPMLLKLELTENLLLENIEETIVSMAELRSIGVRFSLDDFGTGYSSLQYLKRLPLTQLKIDQSFVRDLVVDVCDKAIVRTIIAMAKSLNLEVIAEGVETDEQRQCLLSEGCSLFQGYLFGKPMPINEFDQGHLQANH